MLFFSFKYFSFQALTQCACHVALRFQELIPHSSWMACINLEGETDQRKIKKGTEIIQRENRRYMSGDRVYD
jgi:hypothetical protein